MSLHIHIGTVYESAFNWRFFLTDPNNFPRSNISVLLRVMCTAPQPFFSAHHGIDREAATQDQTPFY